MISNAPPTWGLDSGVFVDLDLHLKHHEYMIRCFLYDICLTRDILYVMWSLEKCFISDLLRQYIFKQNSVIMFGF